MSPLASDQKPANVGALMSYGVKTVEASSLVHEIIQELRLIGHEGYPVVERGKVVGLLTRRDADRAAEHHLDTLQVRDVMQSGSVALTADASIERLEQVIIESGWGQIPILDLDQTIIGIVTRTDLINHWAQVHKHTSKAVPQVLHSEIKDILGTDAAKLIDVMSSLAQSQQLAVYLVGGSVRDLLLQRRNLDIDFVVEGNAAAFAQALQQQYGGDLTIFAPFGTAKWSPDTTTMQKLGTPILPDHIDFATARNEFYKHPTALPTVYQGSIKLDLQRRDFTINTIAIQLSPAYGQILDLYGGLRDLENRYIRVLHSLSFIDDPTRILRAVRFEQRLGFRIEPRTEALISPALPMLRRITGERLRNELTLLLQETVPEAGLLSLETRHALAAIHPALRFDKKLADSFARMREEATSNSEIHFPDIYWYLLSTRMSSNEAEAVCERLLFPRAMQETMLQTARLQKVLESLTQTDMRPSEVVSKLDGYAPITIWATYFTLEQSILQTRLRDYLVIYQYIKPTTNGEDLKALGLKPSRCFKKILDRLRAARLDGEINSDTSETLLLHRLIAGGFCNDDL